MISTIPSHDGLHALEAQLKRDLSLLNYPPENWVPETIDPFGPVSDIVIIGGGMCGLAAAFALKRKGMHRLRVLDSQPVGKEGPWVTFARMKTLRSPKNLMGPASDMPQLTFRAWFEARFGESAWSALDRIPRAMWMDYLCWYRSALSLPVENGVRVLRVIPTSQNLLQLVCEADGIPRTILARKVVIATGRSGQGSPFVPSWAHTLPRSAWSHSADDIDFDRLRDRHIVVLGAGASSMDNAAEALEHGAASVQVLVRRPTIPTINKLMGIGSPGFTEGFPALPDAWRWRIMHYSQTTQTPPPRASVQRVSAHPNASLHLGVHIVSATQSDHSILLTDANEKRFEADHIIFGTGFAIDMREPEGLIAGADEVLLWRDRFHPPAHLQDNSLGQSPYLDGAFRFAEKTLGAAPWLQNIYCFNHAASLSLGKVSGDIPRVSEGAAWLASGIAKALYVEDIERHWTTLERYNTPELLGDEWRTNQ
jgi:cation diffusion facilitator CzcD-associated flavoprotein CzcO